MGPHGPCSIAPSMPTRSGRASPHPSRRPLAPGCAPVWKRRTLPFANGLSFWCQILTAARTRTSCVLPSRCRSRGMSGARERGSSDDFGARRKRPVGSNFPSDPLLRPRSVLRIASARRESPVFGAALSGQCFVPFSVQNRARRSAGKRAPLRCFRRNARA